MVLSPEQQVAFKFVYEPQPDLRETVLRHLVFYGGEYFHRLSVTGYRVNLFELPELFKDEKNSRGRIEKEMAKNLVTELAQKPVGTRLLLQSPREDEVGYFSEVWYLGILASPDTLQMYDIRANLASGSPPLPLKFYIEIRNQFSQDAKLSEDAIAHDIVRQPIILPPQERGVFPILETMAEVLNENEVIFDLERLKKDIQEASWTKAHQEIEAQVTNELLEALSESILTQSQADFYRSVLIFEQIMTFQTNVDRPRGSCGPACMLLAESKTGQPYLTKNQDSAGITINLEPRRCSKCKKVLALCSCKG